MVDIKDIFAKYTEILLKEEGKTTAVIEAISETTGIELKKEIIKIRNGTIFLQTKPIYKNEIFKKKEEILQKIKEKQGEKHPKDIR